MFGNTGSSEMLLVWVMGMIMGLVPIVIAVWVLITLSRIRHGIERIAAAAERIAGAPSGLR